MVDNDVIDWSESDFESSSEDDGEVEDGGETGPASTKKRVSFTRDKKLEALRWMRTNNASKCETARKFKLPHHNYISRWIAQERILLQQARGTRCVGSGRRCEWPELEERLHNEFKAKRAAGVKVKGWWFRSRASQLFRELYPAKVNADNSIPFRISKHWFRRFMERRRLSLRATTK